MDPRPVVVVAYDGAELVDIALVTTALHIANQLGADPPYLIRLASSGGGVVRSESGLEVVTQTRLQAVHGNLDTLVVSGGPGHEEAAACAALVRQVRRLAAHSRRVAAVCTGATILAEAGLLDGRPATTHWMFADRLAARYPRVRVDAAQIFVRDGPVATSGGVTASLDLTLAFIEEDHGAGLARSVASGMVAYLKRPGNQAQMSVFGPAPRPGVAAVRRSLDYMHTHIGDDLDTTVLAAEVGVSGRHLRRLFATHVGEPPAAAMRRIRLEVAARMLATTDIPLSQVAHRCGYSSAETLRQAFAAGFKTSPSSFRSAHSTSRRGGPVRSGG